MPRSLSSVPQPLSLRWPSLLLLSAAAAAQTARDTEAFQMGLGLMQRQLHDEAGKQFARFLEASPQHELAAEAHYRLACCRLELNDAKAAATSLQAALQRGGARFKLRPEALYRLGTAQHQLGDHAAGQRALTELLAAIDAAHYLRAPGLFAAGECLRDLQRDAEAVASFLAAAAADQDPAGGYAMPARYQAGFAQLRLGQFGDAEATFRTAAQAHPEHAAAAECWYLAGDAAFRAGHFDAAVAAFGASGKVAGEFADDAALGLAWAQLQRSDRPAARAAFTAVFERHPNSPLAGKARLELGRLQQQDGEHDAAAQTLAPLLGSEAKDLRGEASEIVGLAAAARGDHEGALPRLLAALELAAPAAQPRILVAIGAAHAARSEWQPALAAYQRAAGATKEPELHGEADYGACLALHKLGKFAESKALAERLLAAQPPHRLREHAALAVAENLFATKTYREAEAAYTPLDREGGPFQRDARFKRAWSVYLQGKRQREAADLFASLAEGKTLAHAEEALSMTALAALEGGDAERAIECADRYKLRYPKGSFLARTERVASRSLQGKGDLAGAAQRLTAAASLEGDGERGRQDRLEVAELLFKKSDFTAAMGAYDALAAGGDAVAARALEGAGWCAFELGDDPLALQRVDQALAHAQLGERLADGLQLRCAVLQRMQRWDDAAATAQRFAKECGKDPRLPAMQYALGLAQARGGKPDPARQTLRALLDAGGGPNPDRTAYELAWAHRKAGDEPAALAAFTRVVELTKDVELAGEARLHLGEAALAANQSEAAAKLLAEVRGQYRARALYRLGFDRLNRDPKAAQAVFAQILGEKLTGSFADDARFLVGEAAHRADDHVAATAACLDALQKLPEHERAQLARVRGGESAVRSGKVGEAVTVLEEFVRRDRGEGDRTQGTGDTAKLERARALLWLGQARAERQEWKPAIVAFQQVTDLTDTEFAAQAQFRMGLARKAQGDLDGAVDAFVKLSILYGHAEWVQRGLYETAVCYTELKQPAKAEKFIAELAQRFPDSPWTAKAKGQGTQPKAPR